MRRNSKPRLTILLALSAVNLLFACSKKAAEETPAANEPAMVASTTAAPAQNADTPDAAPQESPVAASSGRRPNIVFMLVDNFGYGDLGSYGGGELRGVPTPKLDKLAREGLRLTNFNVEPECTPTRAALMTGRMPIRSGASAVDVVGGRDGISAWEYTLAELLSDAGYKTAIFGKWHLGSEPGRMPTAQGFDVWYGIPRSSDEAGWEKQPGFDPAVAIDSAVWEAKKGEAPRRVKTYNYEARQMIDSEATQKAVAYLKANAGGATPFFLYVPFTLPHSPAAAAPEFVKQGRSQYQNALAEIDANSGAILDAIDEAGIAGDTIVIFASDNGPETMMSVGSDYGAQSDSGPFRGEFPSALEGAIRVPAILRWPGHTVAGRVSNEIVSVLDFYRTFARIAGAADKIPVDRAIDSIDQTDFLFGAAESSLRDSVMIFHSNQLHAVKWRNFKIHLIMNEPARGGPVVYPGQAVVNGMQTQLVFPAIFDVENDPKELWNINIGNAWVAGAATKIMRDYGISAAQYPNIAAGKDGPPVPPQEQRKQ